jgi:hypothetical protein
VIVKGKGLVCIRPSCTPALVGGVGRRCRHIAFMVSSFLQLAASTTFPSFRVSIPISWSVAPSLPRVWAVAPALLLWQPWWRNMGGAKGWAKCYDFSTVALLCGTVMTHHKYFSLLQSTPSWHYSSVTAGRFTYFSMVGIWKFAAPFLMNTVHFTMQAVASRVIVSF